MMEDHELFTTLLFVDAIIGVGFPHPRVESEAVTGGLAHVETIGDTDITVWTRSALEAMPLDTLQALYTSLKLYSVEHTEQPDEGPLVWTPQGFSHAS